MEISTSHLMSAREDVPKDVPVKMRVFDSTIASSCRLTSGLSTVVSRDCEQYACVLCDKDEIDQFRIPKEKKKKRGRHHDTTNIALK